MKGAGDDKVTQNRYWRTELRLELPTQVWLISAQYLAYCVSELYPSLLSKVL